MRTRAGSPAKPQRRISVALKLVAVVDSAEAVAELPGDNQAHGLDFATRFGAENLEGLRGQIRGGLPVMGS